MIKYAMNFEEDLMNSQIRSRRIHACNLWIPNSWKSSGVQNCVLRGFPVLEISLNRFELTKYLCH